MCCICCIEIGRMLKSDPVKEFRMTGSWCRRLHETTNPKLRVVLRIKECMKNRPYLAGQKAQYAGVLLSLV